MASRDHNGDENPSRLGYFAAIFVSALGHVAIFALVFFIAPRFLHPDEAAPPAYTVKIVDNIPAGDLGTHLPRINRHAANESKAEVSNPKSRRSRPNRRNRKTRAQRRQERAQNKREADRRADRDSDPDPRANRGAYRRAHARAERQETGRSNRLSRKRPNLPSKRRRRRRPSLRSSRRNTRRLSRHPRERTIGRRWPTVQKLRQRRASRSGWRC